MIVYWKWTWYFGLLPAVISSGPVGCSSVTPARSVVVRRGSWDLKEDGSCCTPKHYVTVEAGPFTILPKGLPHQGYFDPNQPGRD